MEIKIEYCEHCDVPTGNAGKEDGSLFLVLRKNKHGLLAGDEYGPLCDGCFDELMLSNKPIESKEKL